MATAGSPVPITTKSLVDYARENDLPPAQTGASDWLRDLAISSSKWNEAYPYQLIVVEQQDDGSYAPKVATGGSWRYTFPIPPEALSISMPFAIQAHATLGGIVEEHNGAPFRMISLSGTTGVAFGRGDAPAPPTISFSDSIFAGTLAQASNTARALSQFQNGTTFQTNVIPRADTDDIAAQGKLTGYYQFRLLQWFFEAYAELKKTKAGRKARLAFAVWKDEAIYLVTPVSYEARKAVPRGLEWQYSIQFRGWKRIKLTAGNVESLNTYVPVQRDPSKLAKVLASVEAARAVLQGARNTILAIGGDVQNSLFTPMREVSLFCKDALSVPLSVADLADSIIQSTRDAVVDFRSTGNAVRNFPTNAERKFSQTSKNAAEIDASVSSLAAEQGDDPVRRPSRAAHPANSPFLSPSENFDYFSGIQVGDLHLTPAVSARIGAERARVRALTRLDFEQRRDAIAQTAAAFSNAIGLGHPTFNETYGLQAPTSQSIDKPTDEDFDVVYSLNQLVIEMNRFVVTNDNDPNSKIDSISYTAGLATRSGIAFRVPRSKFAVPFPYGSTLEMLSLRYLGDPNRWHEIAALNGLQTPFVDEVGFEQPLVTNGAGNSIMLNEATRLFVGQPVWLSSNAVSRETRRITKIDKLSGNSFMITLDGTADLERFTTIARATLQAFLPNTVNSQQVVYIPSDTEPKEQDFKTKTVVGVDAFDKLIAVGGIDLLLTPTNDLVVTADGDSRWSVGLTNITQQVRLALSVRQGTLNQHPGWGLPLGVGESIADIEAVDLIRRTQSMFAGNPTFTGVVAAKVNIAGPVARLALGISVAGTTQVIPVSADVPL